MLLPPPPYSKRVNVFLPLPHPFCFLLPPSASVLKREIDSSACTASLPPSLLPSPSPQLSRGSLSLFFSVRSLSPPLAMYSTLPRAPAPPALVFQAPHTPLLFSRLRSILARRRRKGRGERVPKPRTNGRQRTDGDSGERLLLLLSLSLLRTRSQSTPLFACSCCKRKCKGGFAVVCSSAFFTLRQCLVLVYCVCVGNAKIVS